MDSISRDFQIFAKPVGANCNLRCSYCYYLANLTESGSLAGKMDAKLRDEYIKQHFQATTDDTVFFSWHGGEPMLAGLEFYKDIVRIQDKYNIEGRKVVNGIQTNGTLLNMEWGEFFAERGFIVGLSVDGPEEIHNRYRKKINHTDTFKEVINGWDILKEYGVNYEILCALNDFNSLYPVEVYDFFRDRGARYITFLPVVEQKESGELTEWSVKPEVFGDFLIGVFEEWKNRDIGMLDIQIIEEAMRTAFNQDHSLCILRKECGGVPAIEKNGDVYCCDHYVNQSYLLGNIEAKSLSEMLDSEQLRNFGHFKLSSLPEICKSCKVRDMCNGGCPKNRIVNIPGEANKINYLCPGYLRFFSYIKPFADLVARLNIPD